MKKIALILLAFVVMCYSASAQSLNVTSAREAQNRGYLDKAKKLIDPACEHEQTKNDAKTWYYAGLIYSLIGGETEKPKSKYKNLDADWLEKCKNATDFLSGQCLGRPGGIISPFLFWKTISQSSNSKNAEGYILNNVVIFFSLFNLLSVYIILS